MLQIAVFYFEEHTCLFLLCFYSWIVLKLKSKRCMMRSHSDMTVAKGSCGWKDSTLQRFFPFTTLAVEGKGYE